MIACAGQSRRGGHLLTPFGSDFSSLDAQRLTAICASILTVFVIVSSIGILVVILKVRTIAVEVTNWVGPQTFADVSLLLNATASVAQASQLRQSNSNSIHSSISNLPNHEELLDVHEFIRTAAYFLGNTSRIMRDLDMSALNNLTSHLGSDDMFVEIERWRAIANRGLADYEHMETYIDALQQLMTSRN